ncbi:MAG: hypothetical protein LBJ73_02730 [Rickettsiales bacterium]|jgi:hypothetical protein|nr:hypothetical protein [Rickettsiales bacterium]
MHLTLIKNPDESRIIVYKIARVVYAETKASSLAAVEALASMIANLRTASNQDWADIIEDKNIFESLNADSTRHGDLRTDCASRGFQMCLRVVRMMMKGTLADKCCGAAKFHRSELLPYWAVSRGYIAEIDGLVFYLQENG